LRTFAVIVAAGSGSRMGGTIPKQFQLLQGKTVIWYTLNVFLRALSDLQVILVVGEQHIATATAIVNETHAPARIRLTTGGATRFDSVKNGLAYVQSSSLVCVHDGVRCLVTEDLIRRCFEQARLKGNAIPSIKSVDSIRVDTPQGSTALDRDRVHVIQTPQTFQSDVIKTAFEQPYTSAFTDEASVAERAGEKIHLIEGEVTNIKVTQPLDLILAEQILASRIS
jgi:2-C-methyl-D-erythritol 4-phosphate cytidylyltransferase